MDACPLNALPPELWVSILGLLPVAEAATFSRTCRKALLMFRCNVHWRDRLLRLGRPRFPTPDLRLAFRAAAASSFVLWTNATSTRWTILGSGAEAKGLFPVARLGPLGASHSHLYILRCVLHLARVQSVGPNRWMLASYPTVPQLARAMLVVSARLGIPATKITTCTRQGRVVDIKDWDRIVVALAPWKRWPPRVMANPG